MMKGIALLSFVALAATVPGPERAGSGTDRVALARVGTFFVGGHYLPDRSAMAGQAHILYLLPAHRAHAAPIVFIPGMGQTITNFLETPDGRPGWAWRFVGRGFAVYLMDQPGRGASGYDRTSYGPAHKESLLVIEQRFTAPEHFPAMSGKATGWPQARKHTQWPGSGMAGDPVFDQFYASQVPSSSGTVSARLVAAAGAALLDRIGPSIVVTHSQAGAFGWEIGDLRPDKVRAMIAIEPSGPPFYNAPPPWGDGNPDKLSRPWGLTATPLTYEPRVDDPADLKPVQTPGAAPVGEVRCWQQAEPEHELANIAHFPVLVVDSEASYHVGYDRCTARYLKQAGVRTDYLRLAEAGIHGNGHMMMLEKNSNAIADALISWITRQHL